MYSENDYRYYLAHGKWTWPNGKNSKEYNHDYYSKHKDKWKEYNLARKLGIGYKSAIDEENRKAAGYDAQAQRAKRASQNTHDAGAKLKKPLLPGTDEYEKVTSQLYREWNSDGRAYTEVTSGPGWTNYYTTHPEKGDYDDWLARDKGYKETSYGATVNGYDAFDDPADYDRRRKAKSYLQKTSVAKNNMAKSYSEKASTARSTVKQYEAEYAKTPIGKAEAAYNRGKEVFEDALKKLKK